MSGPKTFEAQVDAALKELFKLQTAIQVAHAELAQLSFEDGSRNIRFDCREDLDNLTERIADAIEPLQIEDTGPKNEKKVRSQIENKLKDLRTCLDLLQKTRTNFLSKQDDYDAYVDYEQYEQAAKKAFDDRKTALQQLIEKHAAGTVPETAGQIKKAVGDVELAMKKQAFSLGFRDQAKQIRDGLHKIVQTGETKLRKLREQVGEQIRKKGVRADDLTGPEEVVRRSLPDAVRRRTKQIEDLIASVDDLNRSSVYRQKLDNLCRSQTFQEEYFYVELLEDLKASEATVRHKSKARTILHRLHNVRIHPDLDRRRSELAAQTLALIDRDTVREHELAHLESSAERLLKDHEEFTVRHLAEAKERQFVKSQIVQSLRRRRYEVVQDMEVIDFEKEQDFLLKVPGQTNFLNLRFDEDGSFRYNFLISEKKPALGMEGTKQKLSEMKSTCEEFKSLLTELAAQGLKIDLAHELAATEAALLPLPEKYTLRVQQSERTPSRKKTVRQKHLKP